LGTGVLFAAAMAGELKPHYYDQALKQMATSQAELVSHLHNLEKIYPESISAATDITGFGLLGHLLEMLNAGSTNKTNIQVQLDAKSIPSLPGAIALLEKGFHSSLSPANRRAWTLLDPSKERNKAPLVEICFDQNTREKKLAFLELIIDPQTCGPLLISIKPQAAEELLRLWPYWHRIGQAEAL
jgi:selenide,water dikinase